MDPSPIQSRAPRLNNVELSIRAPRADHYGEYYYAHCCGIDAPCRRGEPAWVAFFSRLAERVIAELAPNSCLDAGCGIGLLVEALRDRGVDACGIDFSTYAIDQVRRDLSTFCRVASLTEPLDRAYDLITCIEVLEHMPADEAETAVANLTAHTRSVLFSSTPDDYQEPTHLNVQPPDYWAGLFARYGFYRDFDFDAAFVSLHAVLFRRQLGAPIGVIRGYERRCDQLARENRELRAAALAAADATARQAAELEALELARERRVSHEVGCGTAALRLLQRLLRR